jgi:hypothetical protein
LWGLRPPGKRVNGDGYWFFAIASLAREPRKNLYPSPDSAPQLYLSPFFP